MKRLTVREWVTLLTELTHERSQSEITQSLKGFMRLLQRRRATKLLPRIIVRYQAMYNAEHGIVIVDTKAARELPQLVIQELEMLGSQVIINHTVDPMVIGGLQLTVGDVIIDGTVATRLKKLYESK